MTAPAGPRPFRAERLAWLAGLAFVLLHGVVVWLARPDGIETTQDDAAYVVLSESLREGSYRSEWLVDRPFHRQYPPGYPALLAGADALGVSSFSARSLLGALCSMAALWFTFALVHRHWGAVLAVATVGALAFNPYVVKIAGELRSEAPYMAAAMLMVWGAARAGTGRPSVLVGIAAALAAAIRLIGVAALGAVWVHWMLHRRWKSATVLFAVAVLTVGGWMAWTLGTSEPGAGQSYGQDIVHLAGPNSVFDVVKDRAVRLVTLPTQIMPYRLPLPTIEGTPIDNGVAALVFGAGLIAGFLALMQRVPVAAWYLVAYQAIVIIWPWAAGRFQLPLMPMLVATFLIGWWHILTHFRPAWARPTVVALAGIVGLTAFVQVSPIVAEHVRCRAGGRLPADACLIPAQRDFFHMVAFATDSLAPDAVVATAKPQPFYYYTRRRTIHSGSLNDVPLARVTDMLRDRGVEYVFLGELQAGEWQEVPRILLTFCDQLEVVRAFSPRGILFRLRAPEAARSTDGPACAALARFLSDRSALPYDVFPPPVVR